MNDPTTPMPQQPPTPQQIQTYKNQATQYERAGDYGQSAHYGNLALQAESALMCARADLQTDVMAFSLFGNDPLYCETALFNAQAMPSVYPGWQMYLYHDDSVPAHVLQRLAAHQVRLFRVKDCGLAHWPGTFWRFAAAAMPHVARVQFRDTDSVVSAREAQWVRAWIDSGKPFHVMRDWYSHTDLILAGLWGAHAPLLAHMRAWVDDYLRRTPRLHPTHADQQFLAEVVWPRIMPYCLTHDTVHQLPSVTPIDSPRPGTHASDALGGFKTKQMTVTVPPHVRHYLVKLTDEKGQTVMCYEREAKDGKDVFYMPTVYCERVEAGQWHIAYTGRPDPLAEAASKTAKPAAN